MNKLHYILAYAGTIPFVIGSLLISLNIKTLPLIGEVSSMFIVYGLVIASFMAGSHWGQHLFIDSNWRKHLPIISNVVAVSLWLAYLLFSSQLFIVVLIITFIALLLVDWFLLAAEVIEYDYFQIRLKVSLIVIFALIISVFFYE